MLPAVVNNSEDREDGAAGDPHASLQHLAQGPLAPRVPQWDRHPQPAAPGPGDLPRLSLPQALEWWRAARCPQSSGTSAGEVTAGPGPRHGVTMVCLAVPHHHAQGAPWWLLPTLTGKGSSPEQRSDLCCPQG